MKYKYITIKVYSMQHGREIADKSLAYLNLKYEEGYEYVSSISERVSTSNTSSTSVGRADVYFTLRKEINGFV